MPLDVGPEAMPWMRSFAAKYADLRPQLAGLTICYLARRDGIRTIFTTDRRDFRAYRMDDGQAFTLLPGAVEG